VDDLELLGLAKQPITEKSLTIGFKSRAELDEKMALKELKDVSLQMTTSLASSTLQVGLIAGDFLPEKLELSGMKLKATTDLGKLLAVARSLIPVPDDFDLKGKAELDCEASAAKGVLRLNRLEAALSDLELAQAGKTLREPEVHMTATAEALPVRRRATVHSLEVASSPGTLNVSNLQVADWAKLPEGITGKVGGSFDIAKVLEGAREVVPLPQGMQVAGTLRFDADAKTTADAQELQLLASVEPLKLTAPDMPALEEKRVELSSSVRVVPSEQKVTFDALKVVSSLLELEAKGSLSEWADGRLLRVDGTLASDFPRIASMLSSLTGQKIEMSGKEPVRLEISTSLKGADWWEVLRQTTASARARLEGARFMGIETGPIALAVQAREAEAHATIDTTANQGKLTLAPVLGLTDEKPMLTFPTDSRILDRVQLTDRMANELLSMAVPILKGSLQAQGSVSFDCSSLKLPLDESLKQKATMTGKLSFQGVQFSSTGLPAMLLALVNLPGESVRIPDQEIPISLRDGRIHQDRMRVEVGRYTLLTSGSVGLDATLALLIELPITEYMVPDKNVYELLKDETLELTVSGSTASPKFDRDIIARNLKSLMSGAARKLIERETRKALERRLEDLLKR